MTLLQNQPQSVAVEKLPRGRFHGRRLKLEMLYETGHEVVQLHVVRAYDFAFQEIFLDLETKRLKKELDVVLESLIRYFSSSSFFTFALRKAKIDEEIIKVTSKIWKLHQIQFSI